MKVGLALSGGIAKGIAHIGVLKCLEEKGIKPAFLSGTSAGSLIGSFYCAGLAVQDIEKIAMQVKWKDLLRLTVPRMGLVNSRFLVDFIRSVIGDLSFQDLVIPLAVTAVDLIKGEEVVIEEGPVAEAVQASCAIPGIFTPVKMGDRLLVDGGVLCNLPTRILKKEKKLDYIIAVDLDTDRCLSREPVNIFEVLTQSYEVMQRGLDRSNHRYADLLIQPSLEGISSWDISKAAEFINKGYEACTQALAYAQPLRKISSKRSLTGFLKRIFKPNRLGSPAG